MAVIIKSNKQAVGTFQYVTDYGVTDFELANYFNTLKNNGKTLTLTEYNALKTFITDLKTLNLWDKITEIAPFMGSNFAQIAIKLKYKNTQLLTAQNSFGASNIESAGNGIKWDTNFSDTNNPNLLVGLSTAEAYAGTGIGISVNAKIFETNAVQNTFLGAQFINADNPSTLLEMSFNTNGEIKNYFLNSTSYLNSGPKTLTGIISFGNLWNTSKITTQRFVNINKINLQNSISAVQLTSLTNSADLAIGAINSMSGNDVKGFKGKMNFFIVHKGLTKDEAITLDTKLETLVTALAKNY